MSASGISGSTGRRLDLVAFVAAFLLGLLLYLALHFVFHVEQLVVSAAVVSVMVCYAIVVVWVPRLRVRLDQAGDNAYYLGLLFTLVSMSSALAEFGAATTGAVGGAVRQGGPSQIIGNFGVALASTIMGIFLRVVLHEMRVDPGEVESMTRIELAEASKRIRSSLDDATADLALFHAEVRQRTSDVVSAIAQDAAKSASTLGQNLERATGEMLESAAGAQRRALSQAQELTAVLAQTATEAGAAVARLRAVEPPPLTLSRRLEKVGKVLEATGEQTERLVAQFERTAESASTVMKEISASGAALKQAADQVAASHSALIERLDAPVERVSAALDALGSRLEEDGKLLSNLLEQTRLATAESSRAQEAAVEVLMRLTEVTQGLTAALGRSERDGDRGSR